MQFDRTLAYRQTSARSGSVQPTLSKHRLRRLIRPFWDNREMTQTPPKRLHIVEGSDWKDAVIVLLEPESAYCPWRHSLAEVSPGDSVAVILVTDPVSILTELAHSGDDDRLSDAL